MNAFKDSGENIIFPVHPRTKNLINKNGLTELINSSNLILCQPLSYLETLLLEKYAKNLQLRILPLSYKRIMNKDSRVVINDKVIKLHENDRRRMYQKKYLELLGDLKYT